MRDNARTSPLSGVRVLDLSEGISGPFCTQLMAHFGAEVLKIEPLAGDWARTIGPFPGDQPHPDKSGLYLHLNTGKRAAVLDIDTSHGQAILRELAAQADVVIESFAPGTLERLGLHYEALARFNPGAVLTSITAFGQTGPYHRLPATDLTVTAMSGLLLATGEPDREPLAGAGPRSSYITAYMAYIATLGALRVALRGGRGQHVDVSAFESTAAILENFTTMNAYSGFVWKRQGNRRGHVHPASVYPCQDGFVQMFFLRDEQWEGFCRVLGRDDLLAEPRFARNADRVRYADEIDAALLPWFMRHTKAQIEGMCQDQRIPVAMVADCADLAASAHLAARGFWTQAEHPAAGKLTYPGPAFRLPRSPWQPGKPAPCVAERNEFSWSGARQRYSGEFRPASVTDGRPLAGMRILDLTSAWAGPLCTRVLAHLGAEVIKIEGPDRPDISRGQIRPKGFTDRYPDGEYGARPWNRNAYFNNLNQGKRGCVLDLAHPEGLALVKRLVPLCDAVVENYSARVMGKLGLGYEALKQLNANIILLSMPGFGLTGPQRDWVAWGSTVEANAGMCNLVGYPGGRPLSTGIQISDPVNGLAGVSALMTALAHRDSAGEGQHVELSHQEVCIGLLGEATMDFFMNGRCGAPTGNRHSVWAPQGCYPCAGDDRWLALSVLDDRQWHALCEIVERHDWAADIALASAAGRRARHDELDAGIAAWAREYDRDAAWKLLSAAGIPAGPAFTSPELNGDVHLGERNFFTQLEYPDCGRHPYPGLGFKLLGTPGRVDRIAPPFARDNDYVFHDLLGLTSGQISRLYEQGISSLEPRE